MSAPGRSARRAALALCLLCLGGAWSRAPAAVPAVRTVCSVTVNSPDEKRALARHLGPGRWRFVELVEPGRPDWLHAACRAELRCDVLVISGHYDGGQQFFSDRVDVQEHLPVSELERASCTPSCGGLLGQLKEVYLFGCNTLNPQPQSSAAAEEVRSLVRERFTSADPARLPGADQGRAESSRDRMRQVFAGVPLIYGFSSMAPLGPLAAESLERWLRSGGSAQVGSGRPSAALQEAFGGRSLTAVRGLQPGDGTLATARAHMCSLEDDDRPLADRVSAAHRLLQRDVAGVGVHLDRVQRMLSEIPSAVRAQGDLARAFERIASDGAARSRWLASLREAASPSLRLRLIDLAWEAGWFTPDERHEERVRLLVDLHDRGSAGLPEIELACALNRDRELDGLFARRTKPGPQSDDLALAAIQACLGSADAHRRLLAAVTAGNPAEQALAQAYLRQRPVTDAAELRQMAAAVLALPAGGVQLRALNVLARHYLSDRSILAGLVQLYADTSSPEVQAAVAGILIRADRTALDVPAVLGVLTRNRLDAAPAQPIVDALIRRLQLGVEG